MLRALLPLALLLAAGCLAPPAGDEPRRAWAFSGTFTRESGQADWSAVCRAVAEWVDECVMAESLPPQYRFLFGSQADCDEARRRVLAVPRVAGVSACAPAPETWRSEGA